MIPFLEDAVRRAAEYARYRELRFGPRLGDGKDGIVISTFGTSRGSTALKAFVRSDLYVRELACYQRLAENNIGGPVQICGHNVPLLLGQDDDLCVIEMTIVTRPYVLDFAGAYLDEPPEFPPEVMEERLAHWADVFEDRWPAVQRIMSQFRRHGVYLLDPSPKNIAFVDDR